MQARRRKLVNAAVAMLALALTCLALRGFGLFRSITDLVNNSARPESVRVNWSTGPAPPVRNFDSIHVHVPSSIGTFFPDPSVRWLAAPFCSIDDVDMTNADSSILDILKGCSSLRVLALRRVRNTNREQWNDILRLPLEDLLVVSSGLPGDALTQISRKGTIRHLRLAGGGPFSADEAIALGRCRNLEFLLLEDLKGLPDDALGMAIGQLKGLKRVDLWGAEIGEKTVLALRDLPALEEVSIGDTQLGPELFAKLSECRQVHTVCISRSAVDDSVLTALMRVSSLKTCALQDGAITQRAIEEFRGKRPDVTLTILTKFKISDGPNE